MDYKEYERSKILRPRVSLLPSGEPSGEPFSAKDTV